MNYTASHIKFVFLLLTGFILASCEKVIDVNINNVNKKYVIEGTITDNLNSCRVSLSQTLDITDSNQFKGVKGAIITLQEDNKTPLQLKDNGEGIYGANIAGKPGHRYTLLVKIGNDHFSATSVMPQKVKFDSLFVTERMFLGKMRKIATVAFKDPPGKGNAYRFTQLTDGKKENSIFIFDDNLIDGRPVINELLIFGDDERSLKKGDQLTVEMRCIEMPVYLYWYSLTQGALGQNQSASPANPVSNITGGAIGYFSANTFEAKTMTVK